MKRSETADNILGGGSNIGGGMSSIGASNSPRVVRQLTTSSPYMEPRRRPISQFVSNELKSPSDFNHPQKSPIKKSSLGVQLNPYPPPSNPAPPPPPRTVSKTVDPIGWVHVYMYKIHVHVHHSCNIVTCLSTNHTPRTCTCTVVPSSLWIVVTLLLQPRAQASIFNIKNLP